MLLEQSTLDKALSRYYNHNTRASYESQLRPLVGQEITPESIAGWIYDSAGMARSTMIVRRAAIGALLDFCVAMGLCSEELATRIKALKFPKGKPPRENKPISNNKADSLIGATRTTEELALITVLLNTGIRLGSASELTFALADSGKQTIPTKGDKHTTVYANEGVVSALRKLKKERGASTGDYVFISVSGGKTGYKRLYRIFKKVAARAGVPNLRPHQMRSTFATTLDNQGVSAFVIQRLLGHSSVETTMTYVKPEEKSMEDAVSMLNRRHS